MSKDLQGSSQDTAIVVSIFGTNDAKAVNWADIKDGWVAEYEKFLQKFIDLGATVIVGIPVPYLGNDASLGVYVDMWAEITECPINNAMADMIREVGANLGIPVVDAQQAFVDAFGMSSVDDWLTLWNAGVYADRVHPLDAGLKVIAEAVKEVILAGGTGYVPTYAPTYKPSFSQAPSAGTRRPTSAPAPFPTPVTPAPYARRRRHLGLCLRKERRSAKASPRLAGARRKRCSPRRTRAAPAGTPSSSRTAPSTARCSRRSSRGTAR